MFKDILPLENEIDRILPGDELLFEPTTVINSAFNLPGPPERVYPWFVQLGKQRAGWYFSKKIERFIPKSKRGLRRIDFRWQHLKVGQRIPDYGGRKGYLECFYLKKDHGIGYQSKRGDVSMTWVLTFWPIDDHTRVIIRLRIKSPKTFQSVFMKVGKIFDRLTIAGLAAGLKERLK